MDETTGLMVNTYTGLVSDPMTGESINIFDDNIPMVNKVDAISHMLGYLEMLIEEAKERKEAWANKKNGLAVAKERVRTYVKEYMESTGEQQIRTADNLFFIGQRSKETKPDIKDCPLANIDKVYTVKVPAKSAPVFLNLLMENLEGYSVTDAGMEVSDRAEKIINVSTVLTHKRVTTGG